jgi:hypothetical protein
MSWTPLSLAGFQVILIGRFWVIAEGFSHFCHCFIVHLFLKVALAELIMRKGKVRIHFDRLATLSYGFVIRMRKDQELCQIGIND